MTNFTGTAQNNCRVHMTLVCPLKGEDAFYAKSLYQTGEERAGNAQWLKRCFRANFNSEKNFKETDSLLNIQHF